MKRIDLPEVHDQSWCPSTIRDAETDYLQFVIAAAKGYAPIEPILQAAFRRLGTKQVLDLCSGAGGPWFSLQASLAEQGVNVSVCLSDKQPNAGTVSYVRALEDQPIRYSVQPVDATQVPEELNGFRTMFSAFHHFSPEEARSILKDAVRKGEGIAVFEGTQRSALAMLPMLLVPLMVLVATPFIRPFCWSRLFWTYLIPAIPLIVLYDGLASCLRTYSVPELRELTRVLAHVGYGWEIGEVKGRAGPIPITYLIGTPNNA